MARFLQHGYDFAQPTARPVDVRPWWSQVGGVRLQLAHHEHGAQRVGLGEGVLDSRGESFGLHGKRSHPIGEALARRLPHPVQRVDDSEHADGVAVEVLDERKPLTRPREREVPRRMEAAPRQRRLLDLRRRECFRVDPELLLPGFKQPSGTESDSVGKGLGRGGLLAGDQRSHRRLRKVS